MSDQAPDVQDVINEHVELLEAELEERGRLYEKYGSGIRDSLAPLFDLVDAARNAHPFLVYDFLKEFFA